MTPTIEAVLGAMRGGKRFQIGGGRIFDTIYVEGGEIRVATSDEGVVSVRVASSDELAEWIRREPALFGEYVRQFEQGR